VAKNQANRCLTKIHSSVAQSESSDSVVLSTPIKRADLIVSTGLKPNRSEIDVSEDFTLAKKDIDTEGIDDYYVLPRV
jgi:N-acetyl-gamma-glutamylphosphate reductase